MLNSRKNKECLATTACSIIQCSDLDLYIAIQSLVHASVKVIYDLFNIYHRRLQDFWWLVSEQKVQLAKTKKVNTYKERLFTILVSLIYLVRIFIPSLIASQPNMNTVTDCSIRVSWTNKTSFWKPQKPSWSCSCLPYACSCLPYACATNTVGATKQNKFSVSGWIRLYT